MKTTNVKIIKDEMKILNSYGYNFVGLEDTELNKFIKDHRMKFGVPPEDGYIDFLKVSNGIFLDNGAFYGVYTKDDAFVATEHYLELYSNITNILYVANTDLYTAGYKYDIGKYVIVYKDSSYEGYEVVCNTFEELFEYVLELT